MTSHTCPSSIVRTGAEIIAVETVDGVLTYLERSVPLTREAAEALNADPEARNQVRVAGPCRESGCGQWTGRRCGVADSVASQLVPAARLRKLAACSIRERCRWFAQLGREACQLCMGVRFMILEAADGLPSGGSDSASQ